MNKVKLMVVDDNREFCNLVRDYAQMRDEIEFCGAALDGISALQFIREIKPDVILLDNVMPDMDGLGVLKHLQSFESRLRPKVVMITASPTEVYMRETYKLGAHYVMSRKSDIDAMIDRCLMAVSNSVDEEEYKTEEEMITSAICSVGVPANVKGYPFLRTSISMVIRDQKMVYGITKQLYPAVAKKHDSTPGNVERNIRSAIEIAWKRGDREAFSQLFNMTMDFNGPKPTNSEFIAMIADKLRLELKKRGA